MFEQCLSRIGLCAYAVLEQLAGMHSLAGAVSDNSLPVWAETVTLKRGQTVLEHLRIWRGELQPKVVKRRRFVVVDRVVAVAAEPK